MKQITKRLKGGQDLKQEISKLIRENNIKAGVIASLVGGLSKAVLRIPVVSDKGQAIKTYEKPFEIVSATGTLGNGDMHIHISVSDVEGNVFGGHLKEGCVVRGTVEVVILIFDDVIYKRVFDEETGYDELTAE
ncbi:MAG: hypothetical protein A3H51_02880 [Candidatus Spechtbacteria bacterium RIFCSPLOWO2_02_FULL_38_8]|uniref:PPC domain-containing protein n=1 Tax=Candidatus Spechtbacteria bacterium RIFCSPLOWO2_02_FULL_38_8 TaxID=1802164 RepID=A0A1G2HJ61_9BACT|nr:MAG: hypothetical protein A3H51_02880 [Candidatus Spechtbacteria bacterium RIFCSPLOWO2_02_FULL_38_8]